jgi:hypothetical protein
MGMLTTGPATAALSSKSVDAETKSPVVTGD